MKIRRLRLQNYRRHRDVDMEFPDGVIAIVGRNGSGKTSLLEAIAFALYGTQATRTAKALLRSDQAPPGDPLRVELEAELAGQAIAIVRELRGSQQTGVATLIVDGHTIVAPQAGSFDAVTAEMTQRLGLDRDTFFTTVFAQQKDLARLADKSKAERKKMVLGMMGIDALDAAIQEARTLRRTSEARVQALQEQVARFADAAAQGIEAKTGLEAAQRSAKAAAAAWQAAQKALAAAAAEHEVHAKKAAQHTQAEGERRHAEQEVVHLIQRQKDLAARVAEAEKAGQDAATHEPAAKALPVLREAYEGALRSAQAQAHRVQLEARLKKSEAELAALEIPPAPNGLLGKAQAEVRAADQAHAARREAFAVVQSQARTVKDRLRRIASIGDDACPVCARPMDGVELQQHLQQELTQKEAEAQEAHAQSQAAEAVLTAARKAEADAVAAQKRHEQATARQQELERAMAPVRADLAAIGAVSAADPATLRPELDAAQTAHAALIGLQAIAARLPALQQEASKAQAELNPAQQRLQAATSAVKALAHDPTALTQADAALQAATQAERDAERHHTRCEQAVVVAQARLQQAQQRLEQAREMAKDQDEATRQHRLYEALAGGRGAGLFERFRNHLVGRIGPAVAAEASHLLARFTNGRYTEVLLDDEYDIYVTDDGVRYQIDRFSGGESDLVHLALRLAVSRLLLERSGAEIRFLALDEVFGSLDDERRRLVLGALQELGTLYSQVFLVTHHEEMREMLDHTMLVEEGPDGAVVRMHNV